MKKTLSVLLILVMILSCFGFSGCEDSEATSTESQETGETDNPSIPVSTLDYSEATTEAETEPEPLPEGYMYSYLTGLPVKEEIGTLRPVGFQIDNEKYALPQCGISQAEVVYEVPIEAYEVRLTAIFQDMTDIEKIGPLRSARSYHPGILAEFDGIFFHNGRSSMAEKYLDDEKCDDIEAVDRDYNAKFTVSGWTSGHNDFTNPENVENRIELRKFRRELSDSFTYKFKFAPANNTLEQIEDSFTADTVETNYKQNKSYFVYNADDGLYYRFAYGQKCIDGNNNKQVAVKNIIFQYCSYNLEWDKDTKNIHTVGSDNGIFITNGKAVHITWEKEDYWENTHYYYEDGTEIELNPGQTWVCIVLPTLTEWPSIG
ncbi:MAG: DUF3048 domain-containing protein [Lachnospiraceae bacterium]|nr:DUF3048 domain-containing protein [Candidatus Minthocola equi]